MNMNFQSKSKDELLQELLLLKSELDSTLNVKDQLIAEFKTKENLWHQNEERLMYAIEGASDGLWDWDITNNTVFFSKQWKSMLGYEESEIGNTLDEWSKRVHPDDLSKTMELVNRHLNNETEMYSSEHRVICKDGSLKWILDEGKVIARDSDGKALRAIGTHKDITAKKQIINDFQQSEARYKTLFQDGVSVILVINPDSCEIVDANNAACKYYNWSHDEICRKKIYEINIMKKEDLESEMKLAKEEKRSYFNFKHRLSNGEIRDVEIFSGPVKFNDITLLYSHIQDVTERKRTENALKESEEKLNNIIQSQIDGIGFVNQNEVFEFANHAACKIFELEIDELIGKSLFDFLSKTEANNIKQQNRDRKKGISNSYEIRINTKKGIKYLQVSGAPKFDTDNTFLGTYGTFSDITNRKLAEIALYESEEKFSKAFQTSPYAISISTIEEGKFIEVNDAFTKISGYSMEEVISDSGAGLNIWANSEDREKVISVLREGKDIVNLECIFKKKNGEIIIGLLSAKVIYLYGEAHILSSINDISERKRVEKAFLESSKKWEAIIAATPDGIGMSSLDGKIQFMSDKLAEMYGYAIEEKDLNIGRSVLDFIDPSDHDKLLVNLKKLLSFGSTHQISEYLAVRKDGSRFIAELNSTILNDENGNPYRILYIQRDITSRKNTEYALQESETLYRSILHASPDDITITDMEGRIMMISTSGLKMFGNDKEEDLIGTSITDYLIPEDRERALANVTLMFQGIMTGPADYRGLHSDGSGFDIEVNADFIRNQDGVPVNMIFAARNITERKRTENEIKGKSALLTNLIINLQEGILLEDANRKILLTNQLFCDIFGIPAPPSVLVGVDCTDSADQSKGLFKNPEKFVSDINQILDERKIILNDELELMDGRFFERDYIPTYHDTVYTGHLWKYRDITERKKAEAELRKLSQAVEQSPVMTVITDVSGMIQYLNSKATELTGYTKEELIGESVNIFNSGEKPKSEYENLWNTISSGKEWKGDFHNKKKNGELYWVSALVSPIIDNSGKITHYLAVEEDITERKLFEETLQKSETRFRQITEQSQTVIWEVDATGLYTYVSPVAETVWKYQPDELIGKMHFYDMHPAEDREAYKNIGMEMFKRRKVIQNFINPILTSEGKIIFVSTNGIPLVDKNDNLLGYRGADNDITEQRNAEEALRQSESELNQAQEIAKMGSWKLNLTTKRIICSKNYYNLIGLQPDKKEILYRSFIKNIFQDDLRSFEEKISVITRNKIEGSIELRLVMPDGTVKWVQKSIIPVFEDDKLIDLSGVTIDIDDKKQAEDKIKQQNERLNAIITSMPDIIFVFDQFGTFTEYYCSTPGALLVSENQIIGLNLKDIFEYKEAEKHLQMIQECISQQKLITYEYSFTDENVNNFYEARLVPIATNKVLASVRDITSRKKAEELILANEKELTSIVNSENIYIIKTDLAGNYTYCNKKFLENFGYVFEGKPLQSINSLTTIHPDDHQKTFEIVKKCIEKPETSFEVELRKPLKNGTILTELWQFMCRLDSNQMPDSILCVGVDITERKKVEKELYEMNTNLEKIIEERTYQLELTNSNLLQEIDTRSKMESALIKSEYNYRTVVENVKEIIFQTDSEGRCVFLNSAWEEITGFSVEESIGQLFINYVHPDDRQLTIDLFTPLINREKEYSKNQIRYLTKDGSFRWVELYSRLGLDLNDEITGAYGTLQDITERKMAEDFENELLKLSPKLTGLPLHEINSAINLALSRIGIFLVADRAYIFEFNHDKTTMNNTFEWCNEGIHPEIDNLNDIPCEIFPIWMETLNRHENIIIPSVTDLPESWQAEREILEPQGIQSLIVMPMIVENNLIGFVGLDAVVNKKEYNAGEVNILKVWSSMLASLINNQRIEKLLEQTRQNYETFFNTIDDFLFVLDEKGGIIHTNDTVTNRLEFSNDELSGKSVLLVHPAERREEAGRIVGEMLAGVTDFCPVPLITKSGNPIAVETRVKPGYWDGKPVIFGVSKDITKIKKSEEKFAKAFQSNSALMAISSFHDGEFYDVNESFLKTLNYTREAVIGKSSADLNLFVDSNKRNELLVLLEQKKPIREFEIEIRKSDGEVLIGLFSAELIDIENELSLLTVMVDITERKRSENEIKQARNEAEQANIAKSEFLSRMSHELRTPLNSILGFAQLMEMDELDPEQKRGIGHIMRSGKHLLNMINEVLDISRIEAGRLSLSLEPVNVMSILNEMIEIVHPLALNKKVNVGALDFNDTHLFVKADRQRLIQVLLNLFNNAIKYNIENGEVFVKVEKMPKNYAGVIYLRISVIDTGIGITEENINKLFNPFERIGADKTQIEGTGLGLAVSKKLMLAMLGNIGIKSMPDVGSTFWIELPIVENQIESLSDLDDKPVITIGLVEKKGTILYIEDNLPNIELVEQVIDSYYPNIHLISNITGSETVDLAKLHKPDLILLDLNLPDIHGSEVLKQLKADNETLIIPVVIISADATPKQHDNLLNSGALKYLTKPLDIYDLMKVIDEYI